MKRYVLAALFCIGTAASAHAYSTMDTTRVPREFVERQEAYLDFFCPTSAELMVDIQIDQQGPAARMTEAERRLLRYAYELVCRNDYTQFYTDYRAATQPYLAGE